MARRYTGSWAQRAHTGPVMVPLVAAIDPEHLNPTANIDVVTGTPLWVDSSAAPTLPSGYTSETIAAPIGGGGPLNLTPNDPDYGPGPGHGLTDAQSRAIMGPYHELDQGAVAAHQWVSPIIHGGTPHVAIIPDTPGDGTSPQTLQYQRTGVGEPNDPFARTGRRIKRWVDQFIDWHRYEVERRPIYSRNAYTAQLQPPVPDGTQYDSPYSTPWPFAATPDSFVLPQDRQSPGTWNDPDPAGNHSEYALPSWGL